MLQVKSIIKDYKTADNVVHVLKGVDINFREKEFVAILGPSGCGKTTLLNIIGGLDKYTDGDVVLDGISTKEFADRDWDIYRNSQIGFVFQSYNLIPHLSVLKNVEMGMTIAGETKEVRREKAMQALKSVGLGDYAKSKPNQMSGGQMQRVAIARALVNRPDIILADEPTGALDSESGLQVMELLKEVSKEKLVIMVTHNDQLAYDYCTRIINLKDGKVTSDSSPYFPNEEIANEAAEDEVAEQEKAVVAEEVAEQEQAGIAEEVVEQEQAAVAEEVYSENIEEDFERIEEKQNVNGTIETDIAAEQEQTIIAEEVAEQEPADIASKVQTDEDIKAVKKDIRKNKKRTKKMAKRAKKGMAFGTAVSLSFTNLLSKKVRTALTALAGSIGIVGILIVMALSNGAGDYLKTMEEDALSQYPIEISQTNTDLQSVLTILNEKNQGREDWPESNEVYVNKVIGNLIDNLGTALEDRNDLKALKAYIEQNFDNSMGYVKYDYGVSFEAFCNYVGDKESYMKVNPFLDSMEEVLPGGLSGMLGSLMQFADMLTVWDEMPQNETLIKGQYEILGGKWPTKHDEVIMVVNEKNELDDYTLFALGLKSPKELMDAFTGKDFAATKYTPDDLIGMEYRLTTKSDYYVKNGEAWSIIEDKNEQSKIAFLEGKNSLGEQNSVPVKVVGVIRPRKGVKVTAINGNIAYRHDLMEFMSNRANKSPVVDAQKASPNKDIVTGKEIKDLTEALRKMGVADMTTPTKINLFASSFEGKEGIENFIAKYNESLTDGKKKVKYTDNLGMMMGYIDSLTQTVTQVLVGFSAISLVVSSIMIAIIIYTSVLEREKEIGILRSLGARKKDISNVFLAESSMIGLISGAIAVIISYIIFMPINLILESYLAVHNLLQISWWSVLMMMGVSLLLSIISGFIPSRIASAKKPVECLRSN